MRRLFNPVLLILTSAIGCFGDEPVAPTVSPSSGRGASQVFAVTASAQRGKALRSIGILTNSTLNTSRSCYARYDLRQKTVSLQNDAGDGWASSGQPGTRDVLGNNQCTIDLAVRARLGRAVAFEIKFQPHFAGPKTIWVAADGKWKKSGAWTALAETDIGQPLFPLIMTSAAPPEFFKYSETEKIESDASTNRLTLPHHFYLPDSPSTSVLSSVCRIPSGAPDAPPFWFDFPGSPLGGKPKSAMPSEYFVSPVKAGAGLLMRGSFGGVASGSGVIYETAYVHQQRCDAGGLEYGFYRNVIAGQTVFYISNNSNCGIQPNSYCHVSDSYSSEFMNENNYPGQALTTNINGWEIKNLKVNGAPAQFANLYYSVFITPDRSGPKGYRFQVEVFDPKTRQHATCDVNDTAGTILFVNKPCGFPVRPGGWYQIDQLYKSSGYVTVGIQRQGIPIVTTPIDFAVDQLGASEGMTLVADPARRRPGRNRSNERR